VPAPSTGEAYQDDTYRRSRVEMDLGEVWPIFEARLAALLPHVRRELGIDYFPLGSIERQVTMHGDGDLFSSHQDEYQFGTDGSRALTFVYYFHGEPKAFTGGELRFHAAEGDAVTEVEPECNSIVFFSADTTHEVAPVKVTGENVGGARWTLNGWFRLGDVGRPASPPVPAVQPLVRNVLARRYVPLVSAAGFSLRPTPQPAHQLLKALWDVDGANVQPEGSDPAYLSAGDPDFLPMGKFGDELLEKLHGLHEAWAGTSLTPTNAYGLRVFRRGQKLDMHVERTATHVISSMIFVAQSVDEAWPLEIDLQGQRHHLFPQPGQMLFYEGAALPHGHLRPLNGNAFVVAMLHYRPVGWTLTEDDLARSALADGLITDEGQLLDTGPGLVG